MTDTILAVVWPFASALIVSVAELILARTKAFGRSHVRDLKLPKFIRQIKWKDKTGETALSFLIIWTAALLQFMFSMLSIFLVHRFANLPYGNQTSPVSSVFFAFGSMVSGVCILYLLRSGKRSYAKAAVILAVMSYVLIAAELFLFNFNCFKADPHVVTVKGSSLTPEFETDATREDGPVKYLQDSILVKDDCALLIPDVPADAYSVTVKMSGASEKTEGRFKLRLMIRDNNSMYEYRVADVRKISGLHDVTLFMRPHGSVDSLMLAFEEPGKSVRVDSVTFADCNVYNASFVRYLALFLAFSLTVIVIFGRLYNVDLDTSKKIHVILLLAVYFITVGTTYLLYRYKDMKFDKYPFEDTSSVMDIYQLAFDSSMKKIPFLDIPVEGELKEMENPYDASERKAKKITYRWDYCYKDGQYYCYFGQAPLYTLYYPVYLLTHKVPDYSSAVAIFGTLSVAAVILAFLAAVRMFVPKKNLLLLLLMMPAVACAGFLYNNMVYSEKYFVASGSALAGIGFAVFFGFSAVQEKKLPGRMIMFLLSGISLAVCAGSRPTVAICAVSLLPAFFGVLTDKSRKAVFRILEAFTFLVPVILGIVLILMHNYERFGNIMDFGENYQLTVSDISSLKVTPEMLPSAIYYYFLMPFTALETFPFFEPRGIIANTYEIYRNIEPSAGLMNIPFLSLGMLFVPGAFIRAKDKAGKKEAAVYNSFIVFCLLASVFITWFDFSRGGVCIRYLSDFSWLLAICSGVVLLRRVMKRSGRKTVYGLICAASVLTVIIAFFMILSYDSCNISKTYPDLLEKCEDFFIFWH